MRKTIDTLKKIKFLPIYTMLVLWLSWSLTENLQAQTHTQITSCDIFKNFAETGEKMHPSHTPWFKIFLNTIPLEPAEKKKIQEKYCSIDEITYYIIDQTILAIMNDKWLTAAQKKYLILHFFIETPLPQNLETVYKKYEDGPYMNAAIRAWENWDDVIAYSKQKNEEAKQKNKEAKKWNELLKSIMWEKE